MLPYDFKQHWYKYYVAEIFRLKKIGFHYSALFQVYEINNMLLACWSTGIYAFQNGNHCTTSFERI